ncbi:FUSC family protein [Geminisphaera colitermitum]|uniref:FUSC family protein n=1 Tax=Geminisphaera colitermitum TaxID=1148786 RepID=UPI000158CE4A|nr:FUSC family protein [Geminisphaera colitermitum]
MQAVATIVNRMLAMPGVAAWRLEQSAVVFSLKTFTAAMLALWIAFRLDLPQPGWALMTVYIVSQPFSGMVLSKSLARVTGTIVGASMSVVLVALFYDAREIFVVSMAVWIGACLYASVWLRDAPAAYGAMLAGYTAALVGFQAVLAPSTAFDAAVGRCLEITLAIICATLMSRLVLPRRTGQVLLDRVRTCTRDTRVWIMDTLQGRFDDARGLADLRNLIADNLSLESVRVHAARDTTEIRRADVVVRRIQRRLLSLSALLISVHDRMSLLRRERPESLEALMPLLQRAAAHIGAMTEGQEEANAGLVDDLRAAAPGFEDMRQDHGRVAEYNLLLRVRDLLVGWAEVPGLVAALEAGRTESKMAATVIEEDDETPEPYRDHILAAVSAFVAVTGILATSAFWIVTGWDQGASAVSLCGVVSCIMAVQDNPVRAGGIFLKMTVLSAVVATVYLFVIFPNIDGFPLLVASLAVFFIPGGVFMMKPRFARYATPLCLHVFALLGMANNLAPHFDVFFNSTLALLTGLGAGVLALALLRPTGAAWAVRRLLTGMMRDVALVALEEESRVRFESRMLDRIGGLRSRLDIARADDRETLQGALATLRIGLNCVALQRLRASMPKDVGAHVRRALKATAAHFRNLSRHPENPLEITPLPLIDKALGAVLDAGRDSHPEALRTLAALCGLQATLKEHPQFFRLPQTTAKAAEE